MTGNWTHIVAETVAETLDLPSVSPTDDLLELGLDSFSATLICVAVSTQLGIDLELTAVFDAASLGALAKHVDELVAQKRT